MASRLEGWIESGRQGPPRRGDCRLRLLRGSIFRLHDAKAIGNPPLNASDISDPNEQALLMHWWESAALLDPNVPAPDQASKGRTPRSNQRALNAVTRSRFFAGLSQRVFIGDLKQVTRYLAEPAIREECWRRVAGLIGWDTRVVIGHSLGSVVAYEALCNLDADWNVGALVTLGSPLEIAISYLRNLRRRLATAEGGGRST